MAHNLQLLLPACGWNVPGVQRAHCSSPTLAFDCPGEHKRHGASVADPEALVVALLSGSAPTLQPHTPPGRVLRSSGHTARPLSWEMRLSPRLSNKVNSPCVGTASWISNIPLPTYWGCTISGMRSVALREAEKLLLSVWLGSGESTGKWSTSHAVNRKVLWLLATVLVFSSDSADGTHSDSGSTWPQTAKLVVACTVIATSSSL
eukprot:2386309-Prymnesium_polylepis.3